MKDTRPEVQWFAKQMELKLRENDHKKHWSKCHPDYLIHRLYQEANELWRAIEQKKPAHEVIQEAADVANFAMMIADVAELRFPGKGGESMSREEILQERLDRVSAIIDVIEQHGDLDETTLVQLRLALAWEPDKLLGESAAYGNDCPGGRCEF